MLPPTDNPQADRVLIVCGRVIHYQLRRDRRRLSLRIDERGLRVGAPRGISLADIEAFILGHGDWVVDKLDAYAKRVQPRQLTIADGTQLPVLGEPVVVRVTSGGNRGFWQEQAQQAPALWLAARPGADLAALARRTLQRRALEVFRPRLAASVARLGVAMPPLALSSARTRWGSCSARSGIRLNWRLIHLPVAMSDYVIAHEAAHLLEMNHSERFWAHVSRLYPDWRNARAELRRQGANLPLL